MPLPVPIKRQAEREIWVREYYRIQELEDLLRRVGDEKSKGKITINLSGGKVIDIEAWLKASGS